MNSRTASDASSRGPNQTDIPPRLKQLSASIALRLLKAARFIAGVCFNVLAALGRICAPLGRALLRYIVLPIYRLIITTKLRIQRLALPARGFLLFLVSNRYFFHATLAIMAIVTFLANATTRQAYAQDIGQNSLLFALATDQHTETVEEAVQPDTFAKDTHYLDNSSLAYVPNVDFDYDQSQNTLEAPSLDVPGTIAAAPMDDSGATATSTKVQRTTTATYTVQADDTIGSIARNFNVNVGTILWNNNLTDKQYIRPGDSLIIPPVSGMLVTVKTGDTVTELASTYSADPTDILAFNNLSDNSALKAGAQIMIPGGSPPAPEEARQIIAFQHQSPVPSAPRTKPQPAVIARQTTTKAQPAQTQSADTSDQNSGSDSSIGSDSGGEGGNGEDDNTVEAYALDDGGVTDKPADADTSNSPVNHLLWPTSGHTITQYYGWQHTGVDIDGDYTSPIYAADDGVVEQAGWNSGGYGLMIFIQHPNGMETRYGHSSKLFVKAGDTVKKGEVIGMIGTTGRSTGTHLHFEVYVNGKRTNPLGYIR